MQAALLGVRVLAELFHAHPPVRGDVLAACQTRLLGAGEDAALPFLHLLALLVRRRPDVFAPHARCLKARSPDMQLVSVRPGGNCIVTCHSLLAAVWPGVQGLGFITNPQT